MWRNSFISVNDMNQLTNCLGACYRKMTSAKVGSKGIFICVIFCGIYSCDCCSCRSWYKPSPTETDRAHSAWPALSWNCGYQGNQQTSHQARRGSYSCWSSQFYTFCEHQYNKLYFHLFTARSFTYFSIISVLISGCQRREWWWVISTRGQHSNHTWCSP